MNYKKSALLLFIFILFFVKMAPVFAQVQPVRSMEGALNGFSNLYMEKLVAAAKANYPRIKNLSSQVNVAKSELAGTKISWLDPFSFQYVARSNQSSGNLVDVTTADILTGYQFGVSISPGALLAKPSQIKKAKEQVKMAEASQAEYLLNLEATVKSRYVIYLQYSQSLLPANNAYMDALSSYNVIKIKYEKGEATFLEYNSASSTLNAASQAKIQSESNYLNAKIALEELTVLKLEQIK